MTDALTERAAEPHIVPVRAKVSRRRMLLATAIIVVAAGGGCFGVDWWANGRFIESTDDAYVGGDVTAIAPHVAGFVAEVSVKDNQFVHAGDLLVRLDDRDVRTAADHALAVVNQRKAALAGLQNRRILQDATIRQASADLDAKTAEAAFAREDADRYRTLAASSAGSRQQMQRTSALDQQARAAILASQAGLESARQQISVFDAQISEAHAAIAQAESDKRMADLNVAYTEIRSPVDGYVGNRSVRVGAYVGVGAYLLTVVPAKGLWIDANFKEDQLERMRPGQTASVVADVDPGRVFHGHLVSLAPGTGAIFSVIPPENATGNFTKIVQRVPIRVTLDDGDAMLGRIRPGLSVSVRIDTRGPERGAH